MFIDRTFCFPYSMKAMCNVMPAMTHQNLCNAQKPDESNILVDTEISHYSALFLSKDTRRVL